MPPMTKLTSLKMVFDKFKPLGLLYSSINHFGLIGSDKLGKYPIWSKLQKCSQTFEIVQSL